MSKIITKYTKTNNHNNNNNIENIKHSKIYVNKISKKKQTHGQNHNKIQQNKQQ